MLVHLYRKNKEVDEWWINESEERRENTFSKEVLAQVRTSQHPHYRQEGGPTGEIKILFDQSKSPEGRPTCEHLRHCPHWHFISVKDWIRRRRQKTNAMVKGKGKRNCRLRSKLAFLFTINSESNKRQSQTRALRNENKTITHEMREKASGNSTQDNGSTINWQQNQEEIHRVIHVLHKCEAVWSEKRGNQSQQQNQHQSLTHRCSPHNHMEIASNMHNSRPGIMETAANKSWNGNGNNVLLIPSDVTTY